MTNPNKTTEALNVFLANNPIHAIIELDATSEDAVDFAYARAVDDYHEYANSVGGLSYPHRSDFTYKVEDLVSYLFKTSNQDDLCEFYVDAETGFDDRVVIFAVIVRTLETISAKYPETKDVCDARIEHRLNLLRQNY